MWDIVEPLLQTSEASPRTGTRSSTFLEVCWPLTWVSKDLRRQTPGSLGHGSLELLWPHLSLACTGLLRG